MINTSNKKLNYYYYFSNNYNYVKSEFRFY